MLQLGESVTWLLWICRIVEVRWHCVAGSRYGPHCAHAWNLGMCRQSPFDAAEVEQYLDSLKSPRCPCIAGHPENAYMGGPLAACLPRAATQDARVFACLRLHRKTAGRRPLGNGIRRGAVSLRQRPSTQVQSFRYSPELLSGSLAENEIRTEATPSPGQTLGHPAIPFAGTEA